MFAKRLIKKAINLHHPQNQSFNGGLTSADVDVQTILHYGIQSTASILAFDSIQGLLAIGSLDGRIKVMGGDNLEGLLVSPKQLPYKYLEFLQNQGYLISITNDNEIQVWNLESRCICFTLQWESNITAFSIVTGSHFMYIGDENGEMSVLKYNEEIGEILNLPYNISWGSLQEAAEIPFLSHQLIVGILPQPCSFGSRIVIAYENGLIILWDIIESKIITIWGDHILQLKDDTSSEHEIEEKEITALCWGNNDGTILVCGYVDGDILFWRKDEGLGVKRNVVKLQLSSSEKRIPIIALLFWEYEKTNQLLIYGGDEIGGDEVVTVLNLEWSSGKDILKCIGRVELKLSGSFADVILLSTPGINQKDENATLYVLTNPGKLQVFECASFFTLVPQKEKNIFVSSIKFPSVIPTIEPSITTAKLCSLVKDGESSKVLFEIATQKKSNEASNLPNDGTKSTLTGGIKNHSLINNNKRIERMYLAGYKDGSIKVWDATYPVLSFLTSINNEIKGVNIAGSSASVSKIEICFQTLTLAVGKESGLVYLYSLGSSEESSLLFVTENKSEVHDISQIEWPNCKAVFSLLNSKIQALKFSKTGTKLVIGYECARISVVDTKSLSTLFLTENISSSSSLLVDLNWKEYFHSQSKKIYHGGSKDEDENIEKYIFVLTLDAKLYVINSNNGSMICSKSMHLKKQSIAISMHFLESTARRLTNENFAKQSSNNDVIDNEPLTESPKSETEQKDSYIVICCQNTVRVFTIKSVIQGESKSIHKIKLSKPCYWTSTFTKDEKINGLILLYQTGDIEIRSLPDLQLVKEFSLMSVLRWNFKAKMERTLSSTSNGHIVLVNGSEVALISTLANENDFRIPESVPLLHDEVLAAATKAAISVSSSHKKKQGTGIFGGIVKGLKGEKLKNSLDSASTFNLLEDIFKKSPFLDPSYANIEEDVELSIDDIEIDEPVPLVSTSLHEVPKNRKEIKSERERLFEDGVTDTTPRVRTKEEIIAKYRKTGDASSAAGQARDKLLERGEKLERINKRTEELQSGAEDFASLANELVKAMENRKWWQI